LINSFLDQVPSEIEDFLLSGIRVLRVWWRHGGGHGVVRVPRLSLANETRSLTAMIQDLTDRIRYQRSGLLTDVQNFFLPLFQAF